MWRHIGDNPRYVLLDERGSSNANCAGENESPEESSHNQSADIRRPLDWSSSSFGLFTGLLSLVALIINLIVYFALVNQVRHTQLYNAITICGIYFLSKYSSAKENYTRVGILVNNLTDTIINIFMILAMLIGFFQIRHLDFQEATEAETDTTMIVTAFGMFAYSTFTIIAGLLNENNLYEPGELIATNGIVELVQVQIQLLFITDLRHRRMIGNDSTEAKPGRQIVTFLLVCNLGLWITYNFEMQKVNALQ